MQTNKKYKLFISLAALLLIVSALYMPQPAAASNGLPLAPTGEYTSFRSLGGFFKLFGGFFNLGGAVAAAVGTPTPPSGMLPTGALIGIMGDSINEFEFNTGSALSTRALGNQINNAGTGEVNNALALDPRASLLAWNDVSDLRSVLGNKPRYYSSGDEALAASGWGSGSSGVGDIASQIPLVANYNPDILIIGGGTNSLQDTDAMYMASSSAIYDAAHAAMPNAIIGIENVRAVNVSQLTSFPQRNAANIQEKNALIASIVAARPWAELIDMYTPYNNDPANPGYGLASNYGDGLHPFPQGAQLGADPVLAFIQEHVTAGNAITARKIASVLPAGYSNNTGTHAISHTSAAFSLNTQTSVTLSGNILTTGSFGPSVRGFVYGTTLAYGATTTDNSGPFVGGSFSGKVATLSCGTTYHFTAYATSNSGTSYGGDNTFSTSACPIGTKVPVATSTILAITPSSVTFTGNITNVGSSSPSVRGFVYGTTAAYTATTTDTTGAPFSTGTFSGSIATLSCNTTYHYAAYATSASGSGYDNDSTFTTSACPGNQAVVPTVTTGAASAATTSSITLGGTITNIGSFNPSVRGFVYGTTAAYGATTTDTTAAPPFSTGTFSGNVATLSCNTTYHFAAYATSNSGTGYGSDSTFTTSVCPSNQGVLPTVSTGNNGTINGNAPTWADVAISGTPYSAITTSLENNASTGGQNLVITVNPVSPFGTNTSEGFVIRPTGITITSTSLQNQWARMWAQVQCDQGPWTTMTLNNVERSNINNLQQAQMPIYPHGSGNRTVYPITPDLQFVSNSTGYTPSIAFNFNPTVTTTPFTCKLMQWDVQTENSPVRP